MSDNAPDERSDVSVGGDRAGPDTLRVVTLCLVALMIVAFIGSSVYQISYAQSQRETAECYQQAFDELASSLGITVGAAGRDRRGLQELLTRLTDPERSREQRGADLEEYRRVLAASELERAANPILPARTC